MSSFQLVILNSTQAPVFEVDTTLSRFAGAVVGVSMALLLCLGACLVCLCCVERRPADAAEPPSESDET